MGRCHEAASKLRTVTFLQDVSRLVEQLESGQEISDEVLETLLAQMKQMVDAVLELASEYPQLPVQFARARQQLRAQMRNRRRESVPNRPKAAKFEFEGLIDLAKSEGKFREQQDRLETDAWALLMRGETTAAAQRLGQTLDLLDRRRAFVRDEQQQIFFAKEGKYLIARFLNEYLRRQDWAKALELVERTKSRALLSQLGLARICKPTAAPSALTQKEEDLLVQARQIAIAARSNTSTGDGVRGFELWNRAVTLQLELEEVWAALAKDSAWAEYASLRRGIAPDMQQMRDCLLEEQATSRIALLSYFVDDKTTWLFVLGPDGLGPLAKDTGVSPDHLRACAQRLLIDCHGYPGEQEPEQKKLIEEALKLPPAIRATSRPQGLGPDRRKLLEPKYALTYLDELSDKLLPRALHSVLKDCAVLCISAHGPLHSLPLHALRWSDGTYLTERFGVCYVPSVGVLRYCRERNQARRATSPYRPGTGLVACVDMFGEQASQFEADRDLLATLRKSGAGDQACQVLTGAEGARAATKHRVIQELASVQVIHLSCHGIFASDRGWKDPLQSGLLLADGRRSRVESERLRKQPEEFRDCLLTARDIYNLRLEADLVTLGACSTGRAQVEAGDDLLGLSRAWLYAGTPSLLASLWNVNTKSSHRLLQVFYQQWLGAGQPKWRALQLAQHALLKDADNAEYQHPYHWAPFVLIGDWI
jgi:CHAT domain-containing protein